MSETKKPAYGGQALIEGVMFGGKNHTVTAIRRTDDTIDFFHLPRKKRPIMQALKKIPFLRGIIAIIDSSANGSQHLTFSSDRFEVDPKDDATIEKEKTSKTTLVLSVAVIGVLSFLFSKFVFTLIPVFLAELTKPIFPGSTVQILIEGLFKLILLFGYIYFISLTPLIKRVFQYHGAEHKVINAYEHNLDLTVANVQSMSRLHYRCGSSFILFTVFVGIFLYLFVPADPLWVRVANRIALIPAVLGISFEVLQLTNKARNIPVLRFLGYPGLWLQLLTTKEPDDEQVEVALASFNELLRVEKETAEKEQTA